MGFKIYTKSGDGGHTSLATGEKVSKSHLRIKAYGNIDELNSYIGLVISHLELVNVNIETLSIIQNQLFALGSELACPNTEPQTWYLDNKSVDHLETEIDNLSSSLPPLKNFILPGGSKEVAHIHIARTICRRSERSLVELSETTSIRPILVKFINRLSDWLFVLARYICQTIKVPEVVWQT